MISSSIILLNKVKICCLKNKDNLIIIDSLFILKIINKLIKIFNNQFIIKINTILTKIPMFTILLSKNQYIIIQHLPSKIHLFFININQIFLQNLSTIFPHLIRCIITILSMSLTYFNNHQKRSFKISQQFNLSVTKVYHVLQ